MTREANDRLLICVYSNCTNETIRKPFLQKSVRAIQTPADTVHGLYRTAGAHSAMAQGYAVLHETAPNIQEGRHGECCQRARANKHIRDERHGYADSRTADMACCTTTSGGKHQDYKAAQPLS